MYANSKSKTEPVPAATALPQKVKPASSTLTWNAVSMPKWESARSVDKTVTPIFNFPTSEDLKVVPDTSMSKLQDAKPAEGTVTPILYPSSQEDSKVVPDTFNVTWNQTSMPKWEDVKPVDTSVIPIFNLQIEEQPKETLVETISKPSQMLVKTEASTIPSASFWGEESTFVEETQIEMQQDTEASIPESTARMQVSELIEKQADITSQPDEEINLPISAEEIQISEGLGGGLEVNEPGNDTVSKLPSARSSRLSIRTDFGASTVADYPTSKEEVSPVSPLEPVFTSSSTVSSPSIRSNTVSPIEMVESDISFGSAPDTTATDISLPKEIEVAEVLDENIESQTKRTGNDKELPPLPLYIEKTDNHSLSLIQGDEIVILPTKNVQQPPVPSDVQDFSPQNTESTAPYEKRQTRSATQASLQQLSKPENYLDLINSPTSPTESYGTVLIDSTSRRYPQRFSEQYYHPTTSPKPESKTKSKSKLSDLSPIVTVTEEQQLKYRISFDSQISHSSAPVAADWGAKVKGQRKERQPEIFGRERFENGLEQIPWENDRGIPPKEPKTLRSSFQKALKGMVTRSKRRISNGVS